MKKLFVAVLAIAGLVACNNEPETVFNSSMKSVALTIANSNEATRAITDASATTDFECAAAADLTVLFADKSGKVVETRNLTAGDNTNGTYSFHKLPETVQQVGVIALRGNAAPATLDAAEAIWKTETLEAEVANIVVYGKSGQMTQNNTCLVDGVNYPLFEGEVRVAPYHTRFEVLEFKCTDLGQNEYGYSKITLNKMTYGGQYEQALGKELLDPTTVATAGEGKAWSWNWANEKAAANLVVDLTVEGKGYTVAIPNKTLTINGYLDKGGNKINKFECGNIYKLDVPFLEANIDATDGMICVNVDVTIAKWVVNTITPTFNTNPTPAQ
jgi:hypothetical protein